MIVYINDADLEVLDTCIRNSLLSWIGSHFIDNTTGGFYWPTLQLAAIGYTVYQLIASGEENVNKRTAAAAAARLFVGWECQTSGLTGTHTGGRWIGRRHRAVAGVARRRSLTSHVRPFRNRLPPSPPSRLQHDRAVTSRPWPSPRRRARPFIYLFINSGIEFNTSITQTQGSQQQQYKPEKEQKGYK